MDDPILTPRDAGCFLTATDLANYFRLLGITESDPFVLTEGLLHQTRRQQLQGEVPLHHQVNFGDLGEPVRWPAVNNPFGIAGGSPAALKYEHVACSYAPEGPSGNHDKPTLDGLKMRESATYQSACHEAYGKFGPNGSLVAQWGRTPNYPKGEDE